MIIKRKNEKKTFRLKWITISIHSKYSTKQNIRSFHLCFSRCRENLQPDLHCQLSMSNSSKLLKPRSTHPTIHPLLGEAGDKDLNKQLQKNFQDFVLNHSGKRKLDEYERMFVPSGNGLIPGKIDLYL